MIVDGNAIAADIYTRTKARVAGLSSVPVVRAVTVSPNAATESYLRIKARRALDAGMSLEVVRLAETASTEEVVSAVTAPGADAVIVQLPLPASLDAKRITDSIPLTKDADVLSEAAYTLFQNNEPGCVVPPVAASIGAILRAHHLTDVRGKNIVIVGNGRLVGKPALIWFTAQGANPSLIDRKESSLALLKTADIVVLGAGSPHLVTPEMLSPGVVIIDAGTSESGGAIVGDAHPACAPVASVFTPVPGGVGPVAVACLFANVASLLTRA